MRIAIITEGYLPELSGVTTSLYQRLQWLSRWDHFVRVYAPDYSALFNLYPNYKDYIGEVMPGVRVIPFPSKPYYVGYTRDPKPFTFGQIESNIIEFKPDIIHVECPDRLFLGFVLRTGIKLAKRLQIPITAFYHTNYLSCIQDYKKQIGWLNIPFVVPALRKLMVWVYNSYDLTMVPGITTRDQLVKYGVVNTHQDHFLGIDTTVFYPQNRSKSQEHINILYVGRMTPDKQIDMLLQIFDRVREKTNNCRFIFVGGGQEEEKARKWAQGYKNVIVTGRISHLKTIEYYNAANIFVTASPRENYPVTVLEAMACGIPVVGPDAGGVSEIIKDQQTGFLVPPGDVEAFAKTICKLVFNTKLRTKMGTKAFNKVQNQTWEKATRKMINVWKGLISARKN